MDYDAGWLLPVIEAGETCGLEGCGVDAWGGSPHCNGGGSLFARTNDVGTGYFVPALLDRDAVVAGGGNRFVGAAMDGNGGALGRVVGAVFRVWSYDGAFGGNRVFDLGAEMKPQYGLKKFRKDVRGR